MLFESRMLELASKAIDPPVALPSPSNPRDIEYEALPEEIALPPPRLTEPEADSLTGPDRKLVPTLLAAYESVWSKLGRSNTLAAPSAVEVGAPPKMITEA